MAKEIANQNPVVTVQIVINSHSIRNLASLDKKVSFTAECVEEEDLRMKFAQYLLTVPADQVLEVSFKAVNQ